MPRKPRQLRFRRNGDAKFRIGLGTGLTGTPRASGCWAWIILWVCFALVSARQFQCSWFQQIPYRRVSKSEVFQQKRLVKSLVQSNNGISSNVVQMSNVQSYARVWLFFVSIFIVVVCTLVILRQLDMQKSNLRIDFDDLSERKGRFGTSLGVQGI